MQSARQWFKDCRLEKWAKCQSMLLNKTSIEYGAQNTLLSCHCHYTDGNNPDVII